MSKYEGGPYATKTDELTVTTVAALPTAAAANKGQRAYVTDGDSGLAWGATVTSAASKDTTYLVWSNGAAWTVVGK